MAQSTTATKIERASLKKATVNTVPPWAQQEQCSWSNVSEDDESLSDWDLVRSQASSSLSSHSANSLKRSESRSTNLSSMTSFTRVSSAAGSTKAPAWSVFATMSNVSTMSERLSQIHHHYHATSSSSEATSEASVYDMTGGSYAMEPLNNTRVRTGSRGFTRQNLADLFRTSSHGAERRNSSFSSPAASIEGGITMEKDITVCICRCPQHRLSPHHRLSRVGPSSTMSHKRLHKHSVQLTRGYPTGRCLSSAEPPKETTWDERDDDPEDLVLLSRRDKFWTNTAINLKSFKMFLNSPLFSSILKILTVLAAVSLFAVALDAFLILHKAASLTSSEEGEQQHVLYDNATLIITLVLSVLTVIYSCITIVVESRRQPEGLDNTSSSKPLIVIFSEIIASIVWAQVLSVTIYIYHWTFGCSMSMSIVSSDARSWWLWNQDGLLMTDPHLTERLCGRQGSMVGLELLLVLLLIFNFYTHLAQNFQFIRAVSR
ncbi:hypothetical protein BGX28_004904 [Mortierella sp. GBA30]|nr:hypothetical protein BGX28_004904 [Mortierella sp. GBA30]